MPASLQETEFCRVIASEPLWVRANAPIGWFQGAWTALFGVLLWLRTLSATATFVTSRPRAMARAFLYIGVTPVFVWTWRARQGPCRIR